MWNVRVRWGEGAQLKYTFQRSVQRYPLPWRQPCSLVDHRLMPCDNDAIKVIFIRLDMVQTIVGPRCATGVRLWAQCGPDYSGCQGTNSLNGTMASLFHLTLPLQDDQEMTTQRNNYKTTLQERHKNINKTYILTQKCMMQLFHHVYIHLESSQVVSS